MRVVVRDSESDDPARLPAGAVVAALGVVGAGGASDALELRHVAPVVQPGDPAPEVPTGFLHDVRSLAEAAVWQALDVKQHRPDADARFGHFLSADSTDIKHGGC